MKKLLLPLTLLVLVLTLAACGDDDDETAPAPEAPSEEVVEPSAGEAQDPPLVGGFYDGEAVDYLLTDVNIAEEAEGLSEATGFPVSFVEQLGDVPESATAKLYLFMNGVEGPNPFGFQANVIDSVPGQPAYSPLWLVHAVEWADESGARELRSEQEVLEAEEAGELTITKTELIKNSPVVPGVATETPAGGETEETGGGGAAAGAGVTITTADSSSDRSSSTATTGRSTTSTRSRPSRASATETAPRRGRRC